VKARTVGELKALLSDVPDDVPILVNGSDHSYREVSARVGSALLERARHWTEDHGEDVTPEAECGRRFMVLIVA